MPTSVVAAVIAYGVEAAVTGAILGAATGTFSAFVLNNAMLIGAAAGGLAGAATSGLLSDAPDRPQAASFEAQLSENLVTVRQPITHWQWIYGRARVRGALTFAHESADGNLHLVITLAGHVCEDIEAIWFDDEVVPLDAGGNATGKYSGYVRIFKSLGTEAGQPFAALVAESEGKWSDAHRQTGRAKIYVRLTPSAELFPTGLPNITAIMKGKSDIYDPRTGLSAWTDNPSLCIADLLCAAPWLAADYTTEIDEDQLIASANIDDELVSLVAGGTEARYTLNGAFSMNIDTRSVLNSMLTANSGRVYYIGGKFRIQSAAYQTPTITLDEDDLRGVPQVEPRISASELCNGVKGVYISEDDAWQPTDFPPVTNVSYLAEDQDERSWRELDLPFTKSVSTAQRIAKIELERVRQQISVQWPGKLKAYALQPGDTVLITFSMLGWSSKAFEVTRAQIVAEDDGNGGVRMGCDLTLRETASTVYDWSSGEETTVDPAPDTNLPDPFTIAAPGTPDVSETLYESTAARRVQAKMLVSWGASTSGFVRGYEVQYRLSVATAWTVLPVTSDTRTEVLDIAPGTYEVRVRAVSQIGVHSPFSATTTRTLIGLGAAPGTPTGLTIQKVAGSVVIGLDQSVDLDVLRGGRTLVRHSEATSGAEWESSFSIGNTLGYPGDAVLLTLPGKAGTYLVKFEDTSGQQSTTAASVVCDGGTAQAWSALDTVTEDSAYAGVHDNTVASGGVLKLAGAGLFDDIPAFDDISDLDSYGGIEPEGVYAFAAGIDLGSVKRVQLYSTLVGVVVNLNDRFDERTGVIDDWLDFDGTAGASCDAWVEVRSTDEDPEPYVADDYVDDGYVEPNFSDWMRLDRSEYYARGFEFRAQLRSEDPAYNILISGLSATAQELA